MSTASCALHLCTWPSGIFSGTEQGNCQVRAALTVPATTPTPTRPRTSCTPATCLPSFLSVLPCFPPWLSPEPRDEGNCHPFITSVSLANGGRLFTQLSSSLGRILSLALPLRSPQGHRLGMACSQVCLSVWGRIGFRPGHVSFWLFDSLPFKPMHWQVCDLSDSGKFEQRLPPGPSSAARMAPARPGSLACPPKHFCSGRTTCPG